MRRRTHLKIAEELAEFAAAGSDGAADSTCTIDPDEKKKGEGELEGEKTKARGWAVLRVLSTGRAS